MKKEKYIWIAILIVLLSILIFMSTTKIGKNRICFTNQECVKVKIADTPEERTNGLMYVSSLDKNEGMFFVFENSDKHSFWMKNTLIPLDIIWIDRDFKIVDFVTAEPCAEEPCETYIPKREALYVLELNKGYVENNKIEIGEELLYLN